MKTIFDTQKHGLQIIYKIKKQNNKVQPIHKAENTQTNSCQMIELNSKLVQGFSF